MPPQQESDDGLAPLPPSSFRHYRGHTAASGIAEASSDCQHSCSPGTMKKRGDLRKLLAERKEIDQEIQQMMENSFGGSSWADATLESLAPPRPSPLQRRRSINKNQKKKGASKGKSRSMNFEPLSLSNRSSTPITTNNTISLTATAEESRKSKLEGVVAPLTPGSISERGQRSIPLAGVVKDANGRPKKSRSAKQRRKGISESELSVPTSLQRKTLLSPSKGGTEESPRATAIDETGRVFSPTSGGRRPRRKAASATSDNLSSLIALANILDDGSKQGSSTTATTAKATGKGLSDEGVKSKSPTKTATSAKATAKGVSDDSVKSKSPTKVAGRSSPSSSLRGGRRLGGLRALRPTRSGGALGFWSPKGTKSGSLLDSSSPAPSPTKSSTRPKSMSSFPVPPLAG